MRPDRDGPPPASAIISWLQGAGNHFSVLQPVARPENRRAELSHTELC